MLRTKATRSPNRARAGVGRPIASVPSASDLARSPRRHEARQRLRLARECLPRIRSFGGREGARPGSWHSTGPGSLATRIPSRRCDHHLRDRRMTKAIARETSFPRIPRLSARADSCASETECRSSPTVASRSSGAAPRLARPRLRRDCSRRIASVRACTIACVRFVRDLFLEARVGSGRRSAAPAGSRALCERRSRCRRSC